MIPEFDHNGLLPPGIHWGTVEYIQERFCFSDKRKSLFDGFLKALKSFRHAGCKYICLDGSFATSKTNPGDIDCCWDYYGVDYDKLSPDILDGTPSGRINQKSIYGCEFFPDNIKGSGPSTGFMNFFQHTRDGVLKGIIGIEL